MMSSRALLSPKDPIFRHGGTIPFFFPPRIRQAGQTHHAPATRTASIHEAVVSVRNRLLGGELEVGSYPGGARGEVMIPADDHLLVLDPARPGMRVIPSRDQRTFSWCSRVASAGAVLLTLGWTSVLLALLAGWSLSIPTLMAVGGVIIFITPLGVSTVLTRDPVDLGPEHSLAQELELTLRAALARGPLA